MSPNTNRPIHRHIFHSDVGMSHNNNRSSINNTTGKQGSIEISTSTQYHDTAQQQDTRELNDNVVRLATLAEGTTHDTPQVATTMTPPRTVVEAAAATTTIATSSGTRDDDKDEQLDPSEKERRRQARAFEQQQRILQQVEAARRLQLANTPKNKTKKNNNRHNPKKLIQKSTPHAHHLETKAIPLSTTGKCTAADDTTTPNNAFHEDIDKFLPGEGRQQQQQERPPRTKGLLYRRLPNGYLVPIESRPWTGTTQNNLVNPNNHRLASNRTKPNL